MNKYLIMPQGCKWTETEAGTHETAYSMVCCWYDPDTPIAVMDKQTGKTEVFTRILDRNGNLQELKKAPCEYDVTP